MSEIFTLFDARHQHIHYRMTLQSKFIDTCAATGYTMADTTKNSKLSVAAEALIEAASLESDAMTQKQLADNKSSTI